MIIVKGGVTTPNGFLAAGLAAGIKKSGKPDLAILYSETPAVAAGAFTANRFQASPIRVSKKHLRLRAHRAIIVNSGNANCANGKSGDAKALLMADYAAKALGFLKKEEVLVASTGIIGKDLPIEKIRDKAGPLADALSISGGSEFARAIMTTDTAPKEFAVKAKIGGAVITIGAAAKGVGMIYPELQTERHATMLAFIATDAAITKRMLETALDDAVTDSFNMISVDGDMSTNDSCFIMANGLAGNRPIKAKGREYKIFAGALKVLSEGLAKMLVADGEGATKFVEIEVTGAGRKGDAAKVAKRVATSNLLKCCVYGEDPNWGRVIAAAGSAGVAFDPEDAEVYLGDMKVFSGCARAKAFNKKKAKALFKEHDIYIKIDIGMGRAAAKAWTCDFSEKYVKINSEYST